MTFAGLKCNLTDFDPHQSFLQKSFESGKFGEIDGANDITDVFLVKAKSDLLIDLQAALGLNPQSSDDMLRLDTIVDYQESILRRALAFKQTELMFEPLGKKEDSLNFRLWIEYRKKYDQERRGFTGLTSPYGSADVEIINLR